MWTKRWRGSLSRRWPQTGDNRWEARQCSPVPVGDGLGDTSGPVRVGGCQRLRDIGERVGLYGVVGDGPGDAFRAVRVGSRQRPRDITERVGFRGLVGDGLGDAYCVSDDMFRNMLICLFSELRDKVPGQQPVQSEQWNIGTAQTGVGRSTRMRLRPECYRKRTYGVEPVAYLRLAAACRHQPQQSR